MQGALSWLLLCASKEEGRGNDIEIVGGSGTKDYVKKLLFLAYRKTLTDFDFKINFNEISKNNKKYKKFEFENYNFEFAKTEHSVPSFAVSITDVKGKKVIYTGDGENTEEVVELAKNSDLIIAEAYGENISRHSSVNGAVELFSKAKAKKLALVHICRKEKVDVLELEKIENVFIPGDLEVVEI